MSNRGSGLRSSVSADDVGASTKKPGKLSAEFMAQFESDSAIGGSTGAIPQRFSHASSSGLGSASASHEHIQSSKPHVTIAEPEETTIGDDGKNEKKKKSIWKWSPLKKMRRFFSRKKSSRRTKSYEDLRGESYRSKSKSDENLTGRREGKMSPVARTSTMPPNSKVPVVRELKARHTSSNDDVTITDPFTSKTRSLPVLTTPGHTFKEYEEAGVSFENDPNSTSLEGLQAARDKIKAAPKSRRPPSRNRAGSGTSNLSLESPIRTEQKTPHRRSKTDPKDLTKDRLNESGSLSDILNTTIFEGTEEEDAFKSPPSAVKLKNNEEEHQKVTARANKALAGTSGPSKLAEQTPKNSEVKKVEVKKMEVEKPEVRKPEMKKLDTKKSDVSKPEETKPELRVKPAKKEEATRTSFAKPDFSSATGSSSKTSEVKRESKRFSLEEKTRKSFTESVLSSKSESDILKAEFTSLLQSDPSEKLWEDEKPQEPITAKEEDEESSKPPPKRETSLEKSTQITTKTFKRGKSWSNRQAAKMIELPVKQDKNEETARDSSADQKNNENGESNKDFRFNRTKSWSYGMKTAELAKASEGLNANSSTTPSSGSSENVQNKPTWVAKANRMSKRISLVIQDDESSENQTPTLRKTSITKDSEPTKPDTSSKITPKKPTPAVAKDSKPAFAKDSKPAVTKDFKPAFAKDPKPAVNKDSKPSFAKDSKPAFAKDSKPVFTKDPKPAVTKDPKPYESPSKPNPAPKPKPSSFVRSTAALPRIGGTTPGDQDTKSTTTTKRNETSAKTSTAKEPKPSVSQTARSSFGKIEKCIVCGTTVYQMEKCKFDDSILHRNCIKCFVCKRHLTVGNFVMTESKIYCKPHSQAVVAVST